MPNAMKVSEVRVAQDEPDRELRLFTFKATQLVWLLFGVLETMIGIRVVLKMMAANPGSPIVAFIYAFTELFLWPFAGSVTPVVVGDMILELSSLFAMLVYALIAWAIERFVWLLFYRPRGPAVATTHTTTSEHHDTG